MVTPHFEGIFGQVRQFFWWELNYQLIIIIFLVNTGLSGGILISKPYFEAKLLH